MVTAARTAFVVLLLACASSARADDDPRLRAEEYLRNGDALYARGLLSDALPEYERSARARPSPAADLGLARCHDKLGNDQRALHFYIRYLRAVPTGPDADDARARVVALDKHLTTDDESYIADPVVHPEHGYGKAPPRRRRFSISTGAAAGYSRADGDLIDFSGPPLIAGDLGLGVFVRPSVELQLWLPIVPMIALSAVAGRPEFWADLFLQIRPRGGQTGWFVAPGLGVWYLSGHPVGGSHDPGGATILEIPVRGGYEWDTKYPWLSVSLAARPWIGMMRFADSTRIAGGAVAEMGIHFYFMQ